MSKLHSSRTVSEQSFWLRREGRFEHPTTPMPAVKQAYHEYSHKEMLRETIGKCVRGLLALVFILIASALLAMAWHYLTPTSWHWIKEAELKTIGTVLFSGTLFAFLGLYVRDRV